jgi:hypothetical protein
LPAPPPSGKHTLERILADARLGLLADNFLIVIFDDAGEVDYVEWVEWKDGRKGRNERWMKRGDAYPFDLLSEEEFKQFEDWIQTVPSI